MSRYMDELIKELHIDRKLNGEIDGQIDTH